MCKQITKTELKKILGELVDKYPDGQIIRHQKGKSVKIEIILSDDYLLTDAS